MLSHWPIAAQVVGMVEGECHKSVPPRARLCLL